MLQNYLYLKRKKSVFHICFFFMLFWLAPYAVGLNQTFNFANNTPYFIRITGGDAFNYFWGCDLVNGDTRTNGGVYLPPFSFSKCNLETSQTDRRLFQFDFSSCRPDSFTQNFELEGGDNRLIRFCIDGDCNNLTEEQSLGKLMTFEMVEPYIQLSTYASVRVASSFFLFSKKFDQKKCLICPRLQTVRDMNQ